MISVSSVTSVKLGASSIVIDVLVPDCSLTYFLYGTRASYKSYETLLLRLNDRGENAATVGSKWENMNRF